MNKIIAGQAGPTQINVPTLVSNVNKPFKIGPLLKRLSAERGLKAKHVAQYLGITPPLVLV